jgi:hypothetical protein
MIEVVNNLKEPHLSAAMTTIVKLSKDLQKWEENNFGYTDEKIAHVVVTGSVNRSGVVERQMTVVCDNLEIREKIEAFLDIGSRQSL